MGIERIAIVGAGAFGFALAVHLDRAHGEAVRVRLYDADTALLERLASGARHPRIELPGPVPGATDASRPTGAPAAEGSQRGEATGAGGDRRSAIQGTGGVTLPRAASIHRRAEDALEGAQLVILAVPGRVVRRVTAQLKAALPPDVPLLNVAKALDHDSGQRMGEVVAEERGAASYATMAGGMIAAELVGGRRMGTVVAATDARLAEEIAAVLEGPGLYVDASTDVVGVEYAAAFKNVVALGAGFLEGLGFPLGSRTLFLAQATVEVERLAVARGGTAASFAMSSQCWGNDLVLTALGQTRNRGFGMAVARALTSLRVGERRSAGPDHEPAGGKEGPEAVARRADAIEKVRRELEEARGTVEGYYTARTLVAVEEAAGVALPRLTVVAELLAGEHDAADAADRMLR